MIPRAKTVRTKTVKAKTVRTETDRTQIAQLQQQLIAYKTNEDTDKTVAARTSILGENTENEYEEQPPPTYHSTPTPRLYTERPVTGATEDPSPRAVVANPSIAMLIVMCLF